MSINEIIKKHLPITKQKFSSISTIFAHCQHKHYSYCEECKEHKLIKCNKKLIFQSFEQINEIRWHLFFTCSNNHKAIRWVIIDNTSVVIGNTKN